MELNDVWDFPVAKALNALASFGIPEFHLSVITTREETATIVRKTNILHGFRMAHESPKAISGGIDIP